jgi:hypothetical protein
MAYYNLYLVRSGFTGWEDTCNTGVSYYEGNFGIGKWFPSAKLHVADESGVYVEFQDTTHSTTESEFTSYIKYADKSGLMVGTIGFEETGNKNLYIHSSTTGETRFLIDDSFVALFNNSGEFGVNIQSPEAKIHVVQDSATKHVAVFERTGAPDSPPDLIITNDGRVGINVGSPDYTLHVSGHDKASVGTIYSESYVYKSGIEDAAFNVSIDYDGPTFRSIDLPTGYVTQFNTVNGSDVNKNNEVKATTVRLYAPSGNAPIDFSAGIRFLGNVPTGVPSGKVGVVAFNSFGPSATDTVAVYREEGVSLVGEIGPAGPPGTGDPGDGFSNKIIGGFFTLNPWQRETVFYDIQSGEYSADRFAYLKCDGSGKVTSEVVYLPDHTVKHDIIRDPDAPPTGLNQLAEQCSLGIECVQGKNTKVMFTSTPYTGQHIEVRHFGGAISCHSDRAWIDTGNNSIIRYGDGEKTYYDSTYTGTDENRIFVSLNGIIQPPDSYEVTGSGLTFGEAPFEGAKIEFKYFSGSSGATNDVFYGDGQGTGFHMSVSIPTGTQNVNGDPYWDKVRLLIQSDTYNGDGNFPDSSLHSQVVTPTGDTHHKANSVDTDPFGNTNKSAIYFDGNNDSLVVENPVDGSLDFDENASFTVECWVKTDQAAQGSYTTLFQKRASAYIPEYGDKFYRLMFGKIGDNPGKIFFDISLSDHNNGFSSVSIYSNDVLNNDAWHHVAAVVDRDDNKARLFVDGQLQGEDSIPPDHLDATADMVLGEDNISTNLDFRRYLYDFRVTNVARYSSNFTRPTETFPTIPFVSPTCSNGVCETNCPVVMLDGLVQTPNMGYNITGGSGINFFSPPYSGQRVDVRNLGFPEMSLLPAIQTGVSTCTVDTFVGNGIDRGFRLSGPFSDCLLVSLNGIAQRVDEDYVIDSCELDPYDFVSVQHPIEGYNSIALPKSDFTLSFNAKSNKSGSYSVAFRNEAMDESYIANYYLSDTDVWHRIVINCNPMSGIRPSWNFDSGIGLRVDWVLGAGSGYNAPVNNSWVTGNYLTFSGSTTVGCETEDMACVNGICSGHVLKIASAYLSKGRLSYNLYTPTRSIGDELHLCQRYYEKQNFLEGETVSLAQAYSDNAATGAALKYEVKKRTFPDIDISPTGVFGVSNADYSSVDNVSEIFFSKASRSAVSIGVVGTTGALSQGNSTTISMKTPSGYIAIDSEFKV